MVNKTRKSLIHLRSSVSGKIPTAEQLNYGEIAVNYAKDDETLFLKNSENKVVGIRPYQGIIEVTYAELKALRDGKMLKPGQSYRITDFVTTSVQDETRSAGHAFDIIVIADDKETLNEVARAVQHEGDTYFSNSNLEAWELKYCLDNDTKRFAWADTTNGKGVIWWMKDEFNNSCFYDFKNIQYKVYAVSGEGWEQYCSDNDMSSKYVIPYGLTKNMSEKRGKYTWTKSATDFIYAYTWSTYISDTKETADATFNEGGVSKVYNNEIGDNREAFTRDDSLPYTRLSLNFFISLTDTTQYSIKLTSFRNSAKMNCHDIVIRNNCYNCSCGNGCYDCVCGDSSFSWSCGNSCYGWTCGNSCYAWTCGNDCHSWTCAYNSMHWSCGNGCYSWTCGTDCYAWTCGNNCSSWSCGNNSDGWSCGKGCFGWSCGDMCEEWSCGNCCFGWSCGKGCSKWSCGNDCLYWTYGNSKTALRDYAENFHLGNYVRNVNFSTNEVPTVMAPLKNFTIKSGILGTSDTPLQIVIDTADFPLNSNYEWIIAKNSKGEIKQYCEADLIN